MKARSRIVPLDFVAIGLALLAVSELTTAQSALGQKAEEPATVEEAAKVLDLRTFPRMDGAQESSLQSLGMLMYSAKGTPKEAFEFQRQELAKRGFKELPGRNSYAGGEASHFTKDGFHVAVSASEVSGNSGQVGWSQVSLVNRGNVALEKLPVPPDAKPFHSSLYEASYTTSTKPADAATACRRLLLYAGWEPYGETKTPSPDQPDAGMQFFKRNAIKLQSWVMTTPLEGGKTLIRYSTELMSTDLPAPPDVTQLRYDDWRTNLTFELPQGKPEAIIAFYQERLPKQGWQPTTERPIVDNRRKSQFLIYRNSQRDLISLTLAMLPSVVHVTVDHQTAAEVDAEERQATAAAELARQEQARRDAIVNVPVPLPANAKNLRKKGDNEIEFSLRTGSGPAALARFRDHFLKQEWTEGNGREPGDTSGSLVFTKDYARLSISYFDLGTDVDVKVEGTKNIVLQPSATDTAVAEPPRNAAGTVAPAIPGLPPGVELPADVSELVRKALQEAGGKQPKGAKKATPVTPTVPALPPGVELPGEVKDLLNKALQDPGKKPAAPVSKAPSAKKPSSNSASPAVPAVASARTVRTSPAAPHTAAPAGANDRLRRTATETSRGLIGSVDLTKPTKGKPTFWISPDGRHFAYLVEKGVVVDGEMRKYASELREKHEPAFIFSPDSQRNTCVVRAEEGEAIVLDGVIDKQSYNFIDCGPVFSPDSKHVAFTARRYVGGDTEYVLVIDGREADVFKNSGAWRISFTPDSSRVVYGLEIDKRHVMRVKSVDGSEPTVDHQHGPALMSVGFFFGGGGQWGYIAKDANAKSFIFYDGKEEPLRFNEIQQRNVLLSKDGKYLAYTAEPSSFRDVVVVDGKPSREYGGLDADLVNNSLALSPDGRRHCFVVKANRQQMALIDGKQGKPYAAVSNIVFSSDSKRVAYLAVDRGKALAVVDGQEIPGYDTIGEPNFSPDSKQIAFWAEANKRQYLVLNGQRQKAYDDVDTPWFSPDSKRLVYLATANDKMMLVDNGKEQKPYDVIKGQLYFSRDSQRLAMVVLDGDQQMVVVDGAEGNRYDTVVTIGGAKVHFDASDRIHYLALRDGELLVVDETLQP